MKDDSWIECYISDDDGITWTSTGMVGVTGGNNGNPSALAITNDNRIVCVFGNRQNGCLEMCVSEDDGAPWGDSSIVRAGAWCHNNYPDFGYPRLFNTADGLLCMYYWADIENPIQHIAMTKLCIPS